MGNRCEKADFLIAQHFVERAKNKVIDSEIKLRGLISTPPERYDPIKALRIVTKGYAARAEYEKALSEQRELARECGCHGVSEEITVQIPGSGPEQAWKLFCVCQDEYFDTVDNQDNRGSVCVPHTSYWDMRE